MGDKTVTIGDTEVEIRETEDGFEAVEVEEEDGPEGLYLRAASSGRYGFEIPLNSDAYALVPEAGNTIYGEWNTDEDISDLRNDGWDGGEIPDDIDTSDFDGHASLRHVEVINYDEE